MTGRGSKLGLEKGKSPFKIEGDDPLGKELGQWRQGQRKKNTHFRERCRPGGSGSQSPGGAQIDRVLNLAKGSLSRKIVQTANAQQIKITGPAVARLPRGDGREAASST